MTRRCRGHARSALRQFEPAVIHLDPLYAFQPATVDTNRLGDVGRMLSEAQMMCSEAGATIWITAHMNQSGSGFDLKRITGAGVGEWGDSWSLLRHRTDPDVDAGRFELQLSVGSREWGGGNLRPRLQHRPLRPGARPP